MQIKTLVACRDSRDLQALCTTVIPDIDDRITVEVTDLRRVVLQAAVSRPAVLLLEHTQGEDEATWNLLAQLELVSAGTRVLLLCDAYTPLMIIGFIQRGASGCLLRSSDPSLYAKAIIAVHGGEPWFGRTALLEALRSQIAAEPVTTATLLHEQELLTPREREIILLLGSALSNKEIARKLNISDQTVKTHLHHIYVKLHKSGRYKVFLSSYPARANGVDLGTPTRFQ
ncbi:MAG: response regulator transcription factor [Pseudomonadota bacterium]